MAAELEDRFGVIPDSVKNLLEIVMLKQFCKRCNIQKLDAGDKGFALSFKDNHFERPDQLIDWIAAKRGTVQLRADHKLIIKTDLVAKSRRAEKAKEYLQEIVNLLDIPV
jgi:transcription-repair coupling factor (superfamily II helicase)